MTHELPSLLILVQTFTCNLIKDNFKDDGRKALLYLKQYYMESKEDMVRQSVPARDFFFMATHQGVQQSQLCAVMLQLVHL